MNRRLGLLSALLGIAAWLLLAMALLTGGLDSSGFMNPRLFVYPAGLSALASLAFGVVGLLRGAQRILATLGLIIAGTFVLSFIGLLPWR